MTKLIMLVTMTSIMFSMTQHPLTMAILLMINTMLSALITGMMNVNYWYSFMLFMIMIGGMLVLIIYMTTVASNEMRDSMLKYLTMMLLVLPFMMIPDLMNINLSINTLDSNFNFIKQNLSLSKYISYSHLPLIIMLINYLLITLIAIVKITSVKHGSLRQNSNEKTNHKTISCNKNY